MDASLNANHHSEFWTKMKPLLPSKTKKDAKIVLTTASLSGGWVPGVSKGLPLLAASP